MQKNLLNLLDQWRNDNAELNYKNIIDAVEADKKVLEERFNSLASVIDIQCTKGNWDYSAYMLGMANGLILAQYIVEGRESGADGPKYLNRPETFISEAADGVPETCSVHKPRLGDGTAADVK